MAKFGELSAVHPQTGRAFGNLLSYTHWEGFAKIYERRGLVAPQDLKSVSSTEPLVAHISNDQWVVDCPDCGGADVVFERDPLFWCHDCGNARVGGDWRRVVLPGRADEIQEVLSKRSLPQWRNWRYYETTDDLKAQNLERGDPI